ncbi:ribonuclease H family protein [Arcanobacterium canis]
MTSGFDIDEFLFGTPSRKEDAEVPTNVPSEAPDSDADEVPVTAPVTAPVTDSGDDETTAPTVVVNYTVTPAKTGRTQGPVGLPTSGFDLVIATDGSCSGNPGPGGWAFVEQISGQWASGGARATTNNIMELTALVSALEFAGPERSLLLRIDSQYVINSVTKWAKGWRKKGWKKADGKPVANRELIERALELYEGRTGTTEVEWVRGHAGDAGNELVDSLAVAQTQVYAR